MSNGNLVGAWTYEPDSGGAWWSNDFFRILGYQPNEITPSGTVGFSHIHEDDRKRAQMAVAQAVATHGAYDIEKRIVRKDGETRRVRSLGRMVEDEDGNVFLSGIFWDLGPG
jgi:PAS domain S-box-containing protein